MGYHIDFGLVLQSFPVLIRGLVVTIELWIPSIAIGFFMGLSSRFVRYPTRGYVELFRDTPVLIQLIWFFYAFPIIIGVQLTPYQAALLGLALNTSAYSSEIFRGGIQSIEKGQWEGAKALGMRPAAVLRRVILPQVFKRMLPAFTNRAIEVAKMSSLASILSVHELMYQGRLLSSTYYRPLEIFTTVAFCYFILIYPGSYLSIRLERRLAKSD
jgi:polar amino acid transport system permease protein